MASAEEHVPLDSWFYGYRYRKNHAHKLAATQNHSDIMALLIADIDTSRPLPAPAITIPLLRTLMQQEASRPDQHLIFCQSNYNQIKAGLLHEITREREQRIQKLEAAKEKVRKLLVAAEKIISRVIDKSPLTADSARFPLSEISKGLCEAFDGAGYWIDDAVDALHDKLELALPCDDEELPLALRGNAHGVPRLSGQPLNRGAAE